MRIATPLTPLQQFTAVREDLAVVRAEMVTLQATLLAYDGRRADRDQDVDDRLTVMAQRELETARDVNARISQVVSRVDAVSTQVSEIANTYMLMLAIGGLLLAVILFIGERALEGGSIIP